MFQDPNNPNLPTDFRMLDFQISSVTSPVTDLSYFFYVCAPKEDLKRLDHYLKIYHGSLTSYMKKMGCDTSFFTFEDLREEWRKFGISGFLAATLVLKIMLFEKDEVPDFGEISKTNGDLLDAFFDLMDGKGDEYRNRVKGLIEHVFEWNILP